METKITFDEYEQIFELLENKNTSITNELLANYGMDVLKKHFKEGGTEYAKLRNKFETIVTHRVNYNEENVLEKNFILIDISKEEAKLLLPLLYEIVALNYLKKRSSHKKATLWYNIIRKIHPTYITIGEIL